MPSQFERSCVKYDNICVWINQYLFMFVSIVCTKKVTLLVQIHYDLFLGTLPLTTDCSCRPKVVPYLFLSSSSLSYSTFISSLYTFTRLHSVSKVWLNCLSIWLTLWRVGRETYQYIIQLTQQNWNLHSKGYEELAQKTCGGPMIPCAYREDTGLYDLTCSECNLLIVSIKCQWQWWSSREMSFFVYFLSRTLSILWKWFVNAGEFFKMFHKPL